MSLSLVSGTIHSARLVSTAWGLGLSQCKAGPCAAFVLLATETIESSTCYPSMPSNLLPSFDQPYFFCNPLKYFMHYLLVLNMYLALNDSSSYCVGLCVGLREVTDLTVAVGKK